MNPLEAGVVTAGLTDALGYAAAGLVLATFSVRSITRLRALAIASNLLFMAYAWCVDLPPVLVLHALLLPLNVIRLRQALRPRVAPCVRHRGGIICTDSFESPTPCPPT